MSEEELKPCPQQQVFDAYRAFETVEHKDYTPDDFAKQYGTTPHYVQWKVLQIQALTRPAPSVDVEELKAFVHKKMRQKGIVESVCPDWCIDLLVKKGYLTPQAGEGVTHRDDRFWEEQIASANNKPTPRNEEALEAWINSIVSSLDANVKNNPYKNWLYQTLMKMKKALTQGGGE